jgi:hypothetical protein
MHVLTFPSEFRSLQAHYPIVFHKNAEGQFQPIALLGFKDRRTSFSRAKGGMPRTCR